MENKISYYKKKYPVGSIIELTSAIDDPYSPKPAGSRMKIEFIDDIGQIHGSWIAPASGSIAVIIGHDSFKIVNE